MDNNQTNNKRWLLVVIGIVLVVAISTLVFEIRSQKLYNEHEQQEPGFEISTYYVPIKYPEKWHDNVRYEIEGTETEYDVTFYAIGDNEIELFTVHFNRDGDIPWGTLRTQNGEKAEIEFTFADLEFDDSVPEEKRETYYAMQEDINYLLSGLSKIEGFTEA